MRSNQGQKNQNVSISADSAYDSVAYGSAYHLVKTRFSESEAEVEG